MTRIQWMAAIAALTLAAGCTNMTPQQQGTLTGAGLGAAGGAGIAAISGGDAWTGAAIGAVAGGIAGNIHGGRQQQQGW
jgi:osmotically inducible lipoprotein OsmB